MTAVNDAPALDNTGDMSLTAIDEDDTTSAGDTVAAIVASAGGDRITDADGGALEGIAITAIDNTNGTWQYSTDGGTNWTNVGAVADNNALLLRDTDLVRFQPDADWNGTVAAGITFRAWDRTAGAQGTHVDASTNGGATPYSTATETASIVVNPANSAPVLDNTGDMSLTAIGEDDTTSAGDTVAAIVASAGGDRITDADGGALEGIAVTVIDNTNGTWQYSTDGGTNWTNIGAVANNNALLLRDTDLLRFQPDADWNGTVAAGITFRAWDQTSGAAGDYADTSVNGGSTPYSTATETAALTVTAVNDAPTVDNVLSDQAATEDQAFSYQFASNSFGDVDTGDTLTYTATLDSGDPLPTWLSFSAATRTFSGTPTNDDVGAITVKVTADDGNGGTVSDAFVLTTANVNDAPTVDNLLPDQAATEDQAFSYQIASNSFSDVDVGDTLTYTATLGDGNPLPTWLSFSAATRTFSGTPANDDVGAISVKVTADDGNGGTASDVFVLTTANVNDAPTVDHTLPDQTATEDQAFSYQFASDSFGDVDTGDTLTYSATLDDGGSLPAWLSFDATTRTFSGTPTNDDVGAISVKVTADDGNGGTASDVFVLTTANVNDAPTVDQPLLDQAAVENEPFSYQFADDAFSDIDVDDTLTYSATLDSGDPLPTWLSFDAATRTFSGTPTNDDVGTITVKVTADDGNGGTASSTFALSVEDVNDAPTLANPLANQTAREDESFSYQIAVDTFNDVDVDDTLTYSATLDGGGPLPNWLSFDAATRTFNGTPTNADVGALTVKVTADDGNGGTVSGTFVLSVENVNDAPVTVQPLPDQVAVEDQPFSYQAAANTFSDPDVGDTLIYAAALEDGSALPGWLSFDPGTGTFSGTPTNDDVGVFSIRLTATDGQGASTSDVFSITVVDVNDPPTQVLPLTDQSVTEGAALTYQFPEDAFQDVDAGQSLSYAATLADGSRLPGWLDFDPDTRTFRGTPTASAVGTLTVEVTASDGNGGTVSGSFAVTVVALPEEPLPPPPPSTPNQPPADTAAPAEPPSTPAEDGGDASDAADAGDAGDAADSTDAGGEATTTASEADSASSEGDSASSSSGSMGAGRGSDEIDYHEREEQQAFEVGGLSEQLSSTMLSDSLLTDAHQPEEFREAWGTILGAYTDSSEELSVYLTSAFRAVTESAVFDQAAERLLDSMDGELAIAAQAGVALNADALLAKVHEARASVKAASQELESAIQAAAEAGKEQHFDGVLEDVVNAALARLMAANEHLFVESRALAAALSTLQDARNGVGGVVSEQQLATAIAGARGEALSEVIELRKSWDRTAQDVFSAFVGRLAAERGADSPRSSSG